ncbi:uncharacterized protein [Euwallacea similis]|uniref:uncharacterized protein n=1 Tax=Euwallacea similis TaxID=1736056 RepID=UPI00344F56D3
MVYTNAIIKRFIILISPSLKKMIVTIIEDEAKEDPIDDELIQKLDKENIENANWKYKIYIYCVVIVCLTYFVKPILEGPVEETYGNVTRICMGCIVGAYTLMTMDMLLISLMLYPCRQLKKLDYLLRNFQDFKHKYQTLTAIEDEEIAAFLFFKQLIVNHENIIQYVNTYNKNMTYPTVFDFIQNSIQVAMGITQASGVGNFPSLINIL